MAHGSNDDAQARVRTTYAQKVAELALCAAGGPIDGWRIATGPLQDVRAGLKPDLDVVLDVLRKLHEVQG